MELRVSRNMNQTQFADATGLSLSRISNIEHQRVSVTDDIVNTYIRALNCNGNEAHELRKRADFSNNMKRGQEVGTKHPPLVALLEQFGDRISSKAAAQIQKILENETGELVSILAFSSNRMRKIRREAARRYTRPSLLPDRFVEICLLAAEIREQVCHERNSFDFETALDKLSIKSGNLDYIVLDQMPSFCEGAFACIIGEKNGHTVTLEKDRFEKALRGVHFARHAVAHELAHHYLHPELLTSNNVAFLPIQRLAQNTCPDIGSERQIEQVVDSVIEAEAELFATMLLVPWTAFIRGTREDYLASDYGEQLGEIQRYAPHFKNRAVIDAFKKALWARGERKHKIFEHT